MTLEATKTQAYLDDRAHVFHSWSAQGTLNPVEITGGLGSYFWDSNGKSTSTFQANSSTSTLVTNIQNLLQQFKNKLASCARLLPHLQTSHAPKLHA